jgi:hypothetical protein
MCQSSAAGRCDPNPNPNSNPNLWREGFERSAFLWGVREIRTFSLPLGREGSYPYPYPYPTSTPTPTPIKPNPNPNPNPLTLTLSLTPQSEP